MVLVWELSSFSIGKISLEIEVIFWVFKIWNFETLILYPDLAVKYILGTKGPVLYMEF